MKTKQLSLFLRLVDLEDKFDELNTKEGFYMVATPSYVNESSVYIYLAREGDVVHHICVNSYREAKVWVKGFLRGYLDE